MPLSSLACESEPSGIPGSQSGVHQPQRNAPTDPVCILTELVMQTGSGDANRMWGVGQTPCLCQGPQMAKLMPALAWMLTYNVWPSGLNVDPANSSL